MAVPAVVAMPVMAPQAAVERRSDRTNGVALPNERRSLRDLNNEDSENRFRPALRS